MIIIDVSKDRMVNYEKLINWKLKLHHKLVK